MPEFGGYGIEPVVYLICFVLAATLFERRWMRKILRAGVVVAIVLLCRGMQLRTHGYPAEIFVPFFRPVPILIAGIAVGVSGDFGREFWAAGLYRLIRLLVSFILVVATFDMRLPMEPGGGSGDIFIVKGQDWTLIVMTYIPLSGMLLVDLLMKLICGRNPRKETSEILGSNRSNQSPQR